ncbi:MAG: sensor histidine kinase [Deltaproteobacteria bacterium]
MLNGENSGKRHGGNKPPVLREGTDHLEGPEASLAIYQNLFEFLPDAVVIVNRDGHIVQANAQAERIFGYNRVEMIGQLVEILIPDRFSKRHAAYRKAYMSEPQRRSMGIGLQLYGRRKDGGDFPVDIALIPVDIGKDLLVVGIIRDYTWRKRGEEAAFRLAAIVESSADAIVGINLDGIIFSWNQGAERIYGYSLEEARGSSFSILVPPDRSHEIPEILNQVRRGNPVTNFETVRTAKDGRLIHVSLSLSPIKDTSGNIIGFSHIGRDISDRKRAEEEIKRANERLAQSYEACEITNKELEAFTYSASHDLRAPLVAVGGLARLLLEEYSGSLDAKGEKFLQTIQKVTDQMKQLVDDLLSLSRFGHQALEMSKIDMDELAKGIIDELKLLYSGRRLRWNIKPLPPARGDPVMIRQVLMNLLSNAIKFTRFKPEAVIELGGKAEEDTIIFYVRDNGVGFNMGEADKLFEVFRRLHPSQEFEGTGVGLAIVKRIIQRHEGRVWAEGRVNEGATFYFSLPR